MGPEAAITNTKSETMRATLRSQRECFLLLAMTAFVLRLGLILRSNFGAELRIGNGPLADGTWQQYLHPTQNVYEMRRYREMGELAYVNARKREALAFIRADHSRFALLCLKRFIYYWAGRPRLSEIPALTILCSFLCSLRLPCLLFGAWRVPCASMCLESGSFCG